MIIWEGKKIEEAFIGKYLREKYPGTKSTFLTRRKKVKGDYLPLLQNDFGMNNDCTLTALTTVISGAVDQEPHKVYDVVEKYAKQYGFKGNGTNPLFIKSIFDKTLKEFSVNKKTKAGYLKSVGYGFSKIKELIDKDIPVVLSVYNDGRNYYINHTIAVVGYLTYRVDKNQSLEPFLLVYDNWEPKIRVIDYKTLSLISSINFFE